MNDQWDRSTIAMMAASPTMTRNAILFAVSNFEALFPPPNFIENIGISLTNRKQRTRAKTGMKTGPWHQCARKQSGLSVTNVAYEPQIIAAAGVGSPMKLSC